MGSREMAEDSGAYAERFGPWALIAGASEGVGAAYARAIAERGVNVVLLARRQEVLDEVAAAIARDTGAETRTLSVDLSRDDAVAEIKKATSDLEIGTFMYCAGADPVYEPFLDNPVDVALELVKRNCLTSLQLCHHFAGPMVDRGRGAILVLSSGGGLVGGRNMVAYGASKAFDIVMTEALWAEIHDRGVNVLSLVLGPTDTPALRRILLKRGAIPAPDAPIPDAVTVDEVVKDALEQIENGPTWFVGELLREGSKMLGSLTRSEAAHALLQVGGGLMDAQGDTSEKLADATGQP